jgi:hypothetical protein
MSGARVAEIRRTRQPFVERLLPVGGFRADASALTSEPVEPVACFVAHVDDATGDGGSAAVESVLRADRADIQVADSTLVEQSNAFADVWLPANAVWSHQTSSLLVQAFNERPVGTLKLVSEHHAPVTVRRRRATNRALAIDASAADEAAIELFGVAAYLACDMGIGADAVPAMRRSWRSAALARGWRRIKWWIRRNESNGDRSTQCTLERSFGRLVETQNVLDLTIRSQAAMIEPDGTVAGLPDLVQVMRDHDDGARVFPDLDDSFEAALTEVTVADGEGLVDEEDVRDAERRNRER